MRCDAKESNVVYLILLHRDHGTGKTASTKRCNPLTSKTKTNIIPILIPFILGKFKSVDGRYIAPEIIQTTKNLEHWSFAYE